MKDEEKYIRRCIQLAKNGLLTAPPNPMVGAVIVCDGKVIGEGFHIRPGEAHAEVNAINSVRDKAMLRRSTIYVSLEPCSHYGKTPPCADLIIKMGIPRVVIGCMDPFPEVAGRGIRKLREAGREVIVGVLEEECRRLIRRFITFHTEQRPYITLKWAESADKYIDKIRTELDPSKAEGTPFVFSSPLTAMMAHKRRAEHSAILVGRRTALLDNPSLTDRHWSGHQPVRLVIDRQLTLPRNLHLFDGSVPTIVFTERSMEAEVSAGEENLKVSDVNLRVSDVTLRFSDANVNLEFVTLDFSRDILPQMMKTLYNRGLQSLLVEGGSRLLQSFIDHELWDEAFVEQSAEVLGEGVASPVFPKEIPCEENLVFGRRFLHFEAAKIRQRSYKETI